MNHSQESFERGQALARIDSALPAATYNLTRILLANNPNGSVFVPIRTMQYLAVIDREEIIFVDSQYKRWVEVAWRQFRPDGRSALDDPVNYAAVFYTAEGEAIQRRLQAEFHGALALLASRRPSPGSAHILPLWGKGG